MSGQIDRERKQMKVDEVLTKWTSYLTFPPNPPRKEESPVSTMGLFTQALSQMSRPSSPTQDPIPTGLLADLQKIGLSGAYRDMTTLVDLLKAKVDDGGIVDDKTYLMERIIQVASSLPTSSKNQKVLTGALLDKLWNQLQHPPLSYLGSKNQYRSADGSYNNIMYPHLGKAGTPYARSVRPMKKMPGARPDPSLIFDTLMARKKYNPHPNKISSMLFYLASIIIHDLFRTSHQDFAISKTSSYLDLSPLYGSDEDEQKEMRTYKDGKIKPDAFSEKRLLGFPPGVCVLLLSFGRFHNYIVETLLKINQDQRFTRRMTPEQTDEKLFQTGRLITCGLYINMILIDYIRVILNLTRTDSTWCLDPRSEIEKIFSSTGTPQGIGNQVSAEFNLVYRWHSVISERDDKWTQELYGQIFPGRNPSDITLPEFIAGLGKWEQQIPKDPGERTFGGLERDPETHKFSDEKLVKILTESIEDCANSYGANQVPAVMRAIEILGIEQARSWELASLNEFRAFFGLKEYETFEDINPDEQVAETLRQLYGHPDYVEIYPGLVVEAAKEKMAPGAGLLPGFTISTAILSDAVALVRGDRFYTIDYTAGNLTNWGYNEVATNPEIAYGGVSYKLFHRAFPGWFEPNSAYAMFPFTIPSENKAIYEEFGQAHKYIFTPPSKLTEDNVNTRTLRLLGDSSELDTNGIISKIAECPSWMNIIQTSLTAITKQVIQEKSRSLGVGIWVDAIRDVGNIIASRATAELFSLPLTGVPGTPDAYTEHELHGVLCTIANYVYQVVPVPDAKGFEVFEVASSFWDALIGVDFVEVEGHHRLRGLHSAFTTTDLAILGKELQDSFGAEGQSKEIILTAAKFCLDLSIGFTEILRHYLEPENAEILKEICDAGEDSGPALRATITALKQSTLAARTGCDNEVVLKTLTSMLQSIGSLKNLRSAPGPQGKIHVVEMESVSKGDIVDKAECYISEDWGMLSAYPTTVKVMFDSF